MTFMRALTRMAFDVLFCAVPLYEKSFDSLINLLYSVVDQLLRYLPAELAVRRFHEHEHFWIDPESGLGTVVVCVRRVGGRLVLCLTMDQRHWLGITSNKPVRKVEETKIASISQQRCLSRASNHVSAVPCQPRTDGSYFHYTWCV